MTREQSGTSRGNGEESSNVLLQLGRHTMVFFFLSTALLGLTVGPLALLVLMRESSLGVLGEVGRAIFPVDSKGYLYALAGGLSLAALSGPLASKLRVSRVNRYLFFLNDTHPLPASRSARQFLRRLRLLVDGHFDLSYSLVRLPLIMAFAVTLWSAPVLGGVAGVLVVGFVILPTRLRGAKDEFLYLEEERRAKKANTRENETAPGNSLDFLQWVSFKRSLTLGQLVSLVAPVVGSLGVAIFTGEVSTIQQLLVHSAVLVMVTLTVSELLLGSAHYSLLRLQVSEARQSLGRVTGNPESEDVN